ncbi:hypothetical protein V3N99_17690 [Dermatophilaceae bacterium Soc4.6]
MRTIDLTLIVPGPGWLSLRSCVTEALEIVDPGAFFDRVGFPRDRAFALRSALRTQSLSTRSLSDDDLALAIACIDLACELVDDVEFETRVGIDKPAARRLAATLHTAAAR